MKITILTENTAEKRGLLAEHGLSVLIETGDKRILFDTGQSGTYARNADRLHVSLEGLDAVVLSHGHYDHTGGLEEFPGKELPTVYVRREAFHDKLCRDGKGGFRRICIPWRERGLQARFHFTEELEEIFPDIFVLGDIPAVMPQEPEGDIFYQRIGSDLTADHMRDEQLLVVRLPQGLAVFAGCAHVGILNCLEKVKGAFPGERICFLLAGMHLRNCGPKRLEDTVSALADYGILRLVPLHCTGMEAIVRMREAFGAGCLAGDVGRQYEL